MTKLKCKIDSVKERNGYFEVRLKCPGNPKDNYIKSLEDIEIGDIEKAKIDPRKNRVFGISKNPQNPQ